MDWLITNSLKLKQILAISRSFDCRQRTAVNEPTMHVSLNLYSETTNEKTYLCKRFALNCIHKCVFLSVALICTYCEGHTTNSFELQRKGMLSKLSNSSPFLAMCLWHYAITSNHLILGNLIQGQGKQHKLNGILIPILNYKHQVSFIFSLFMWKLLNTNYYLLLWLVSE